jgi:hypothetical protein
MNDPKNEPPVRQREMPASKDEPVQRQPANDRPMEGAKTNAADESQGVVKDELAREQAVDKRGAE